MEALVEKAAMGLADSWFSPLDHNLLRVNILERVYDLESVRQTCFAPVLVIWTLSILWTLNFPAWEREDFGIGKWWRFLEKSFLPGAGGGCVCVLQHFGWMEWGAETREALNRSVSNYLGLSLHCTLSTVTLKPTSCCCLATHLHHPGSEPGGPMAADGGKWPVWLQSLRGIERPFIQVPVSKKGDGFEDVCSFPQGTLKCNRISSYVRKSLHFRKIFTVAYSHSWTAYT